MRMLGAEAVIECLKAEEVEIVFGYPGGAVLTLYDALFKTNFPHVLTRHEQGAVHAADGYARATGKTGVCFATSGPGGTNLVTGIATAYMDSIPLVAITGQVGVSLIGKDSFQEADICGITTPITKHNYLVKKVQDLPRVIKEAFYIARTGRPGPVVIDISKDVFNDTLDFEYPDSVELRGYKPIFSGDASKIDLVVTELEKAKKPLLFIGGGVNISGTSEELRKFVESTGIPVITSLMGLGCIPCDSAQHLGMVGMHGTYAANMATMECDLLLGVGVRFDDRVTSLVKNFAPKAKIVHFDIDPAEVNKNVRSDFRVIGDLRWSLPLLAEKASMQGLQKWQQETGEWNKLVQEWKKEKPPASELEAAGIKPQAVIEKVSELTKGDAIIVTDVGQHQMWTAQSYTFKKQRSFLTSGGLGTMGYGLPAAIGAQITLPEKTVVLFTGDGSIMMNCQELATMADNGLPVKIIVMNNQVLGMVNQWQRMFYGKRYSHSSTKGCTDFVKLAEAMGVTGLCVTEPEKLDAILEKALKMEGPVLVEVLLPATEDVLPMVPPGGRLDQMVLGGVF
ncbi:biosynthetic-type acetolactate synthase large subunit [Pelosinus sp. IPA-1]|uniref:biosynthetic-type acetolactate synthase large subunit n=1 Tax=Pelosinus sp. IPA-1 TaxID=3029569 RepID=UPI0024362A51|nr:biosynthetic-type acetolactate synthase large subunit [Pelosinus sp. IPA-1]GMA98305.1 acetolactate synthase, large subunit, biosynthetic type [Pelosinus sp. IPA-1]